MSKLIRSFKDLSIKQFFSLLSLVVLVIPSIVGSLVLATFQLDKNKASLQAYEEETLKILATAMQNPLYDFDKERSSPLIDHLLIEEEILAIRVYDFEGELFLERTHGDHTLESRTESRPVFYNQKPIGRVEIDFNEGGMHGFLAEYKSVYTILFVILILALIAFNFFSNVKILRPVKYLISRSKMLSQNQLEGPIEIFHHDELGELAEMFEEMRLSLKTHIEHLDTLVQERTKALNELNTNLEKRVAAQVEELRMKDHLLIQNAKMAAMGEMIGAIAHQWRQPISVVGMTANQIKLSLAMGKELAPDELDGYMDAIGEQVQHLSRTIDDFRNFFSPSKEKKLFVPCEAVQEVYKLIEAQMMTRDIPLIVHTHEHFHVLGFPNEFKQVLLNLINNAQYAFSERKIQEGKIEIFFENDGTFGTLRVKDNAGGIPEELLPDKLFLPYVTTKGDKGTGIGLQISKTIIESNMGGSITAHNVDNGAEFIIRLPLARQETESERYRL